MKKHYSQFRVVSSTLVVSLVLLSLSCSKGGSSKMTKEEKAFAEQWNQWIEDNQTEVVNLRTRAIADSMTKEEISREMIALMVRFSSESKLTIPQRFIDDIKKQAAQETGD